MPSKADLGPINIRIPGRAESTIAQATLAASLDNNMTKKITEVMQVRLSRGITLLV